MTVIASPVSYLTGLASHKHIPWLERQPDGENLTVLRAYTYPALHRSFVHRVFSFLSFMFSSFVIGLGVKNVDLVWGTSPPIFQGATAWALARLKRVPFLFEVRDLWPAFAIAVGVLRSPLLIRASQWLEGFLYRQAHTVMVNSPGFIAHVKSRGARQVALIPNGADTQMFHPEQNGAEFRHSHGLEGKYVVLYAGAHGLSNDLQVVLEAAHQLEERTEIVIVLLGDGKDKPKLQAQASEMGLKNILFLPPLPKTQMPEALSAADACIAILKPIEMYQTVFPNKVFDYMAAGRPVILAIGGVIKQTIEQAQGGIPVEPGNPTALAQAILRLADDRSLGKQMGMNGRRYLEAHYDRAKLASDLTTLIENILQLSQKTVPL